MYSGCNAWGSLVKGFPSSNDNLKNIFLTILFNEQWDFLKMRVLILQSNKITF